MKYTGRYTPWLDGGRALVCPSLSEVGLPLLITASGMLGCGCSGPICVRSSQVWHLTLKAMEECAQPGSLDITTRLGGQLVSEPVDQGAEARRGGPGL